MKPNPNPESSNIASLIKWVILGILVIFSCYVTFPMKEKVRLGLDLQGGTAFTVALDKEKLETEVKQSGVADVNQEMTRRLDGATDRTLGVLRRRIDALGTNEPIIARDTSSDRIFIQIPGADEAQAEQAKKSIERAAYLEFRIVDRQNADRVAEAMSTMPAPMGYAYDAKKSFLYRTDDYSKIMENQKTALEAKISMDAYGQMPGYLRLFTCFMEEIGKDGEGRTTYRPIFLSKDKNDGMNGSTISKATAEVNTTSVSNPNVVSLEFNEEGTRLFGDLTTRNVGRQMAIILDGVVYSAPVIQEPMTNGHCQITGNFEWKEVTDLANILNAGSLSVPIKVVEKRSVSPTLGQEAISRGKNSAIIGVAAVLIFMLVYYAYCGVVANIALLLNMILWPAGMIIASGIMSVFISDGTGSNSLGQLPVLTLPGIAGLVLSVGMAVDANVLVFERMREEFTAGKTTKDAVAAGYNRAFLAIVDSNLTTLMTGVILFIFGSGPIRGFAVTLCGGIIISMFTALVVTRLIFNLFVTNRTKPFKMMKWVSDKITFNFIKHAKIAASVSAFIIVVTVGLFAWRATTTPASVFAVDFVGGLSLTYKAVDKANPNKVVELDTEVVRKVVAKTGVTDQTIQKVTGENGEVFTLVKTSTTMLGDKHSKDVIEKAIDDAFPNATVTIHSEDEVGSQIGEELKEDAFWSICIALIGIIVYVSFRFRFGFALGGVVALAHDALITLGIYSILGNQVSLTTVAALLTIVGYSINDTIVVFDRVREEMERDDTTPFPQLVCRALNQTLSRTLLTTMSTLLPVAALFFFGGAAIHDFALALFIGMIAGTYSTLFIAPGVMLLWYKGKRPPKPVDPTDPTDVAIVE